jgi:phosphoserine phosphatase RsbU/P
MVAVGAVTVEEIEVRRLDAVRRYDILDTPPDQAFDRITALAARACDAPIAIVSIVDEDRIWFKSHHGLDVSQIDRYPGLCASAILYDGPWVIDDASTDPRSLTNPLVAGEFGLRFYLGVPLCTADGHNLGTLCVLDFEARPATSRQIADLTDLAAIVMDELELRLAASRNYAMQAELRRRAESLARKLQGGLLPARLPTINNLELGARYLPAEQERVGGDFYDVFATGNGAALVIGDICGHGPDAAALTALARHTIRALCTDNWTPGQVLEGLNRAVLASDAGDDFPHCTVALLRGVASDAGLAVTVALGGHPLPVLLREDGSTEEVGISGQIIGCFPSAHWPEEHFVVHPAETLVLYTDGLTEASGGATRFDVQQLRAAIRANVGQTADVIARNLLAAMSMTESKPRDDVAILVARFSPEDAADQRFSVAKPAS